MEVLGYQFFNESFAMLKIILLKCSSTIERKRSMEIVHMNVGI